MKTISGIVLILLLFVLSAGVTGCGELPVLTEGLEEPALLVVQSRDPDYRVALDEYLLGIDAAARGTIISQKRATLRNVVLPDKGFQEKVDCNVYKFRVPVIKIIRNNKNAITLDSPDAKYVTLDVYSEIGATIPMVIPTPGYGFGFFAFPLNHPYKTLDENTEYFLELQRLPGKNQFLLPRADVQIKGCPDEIHRLGKLTDPIALACAGDPVNMLQLGILPESESKPSQAEFSIDPCGTTASIKLRAGFMNLANAPVATPFLMDEGCFYLEYKTPAGKLVKHVADNKLTVRFERTVYMIRPKGCRLFKLHFNPLTFLDEKKAHDVRDCSREPADLLFRFRVDEIPTSARLFYRANATGKMQKHPLWKGVLSTKEFKIREISQRSKALKMLK